ncbi:helix-turn-helix domain-containing protein [Alkaliphilus metalliredigens]|nr:helix-turn-helix transcriptional regulator [Alkaliphilus metalliredigens]
MKVNMQALQTLINEKQWTIYKLSQVMGLDYSYVYRVFNEQSRPGYKFIEKLLNMCNKLGLDPNDYIFFTHHCL